jgi:cystathionine gamma-synthase
LHVRIKQHVANAQYLVERLPQLDGVEKVLYPGTGGMISFYLANGYDVNAFLRSLKVFSFAESLGGAESLITIPAVQTHHDMPEAQREALGITENLVRISVGLEDERDLWADIEQSINNAN